MGVESILKILIEVNQLTISNGRFIQALKESVKRVLFADSKARLIEVISTVEVAYGLLWRP